MTTFSIGRHAEQVAANYLKDRSYKILDQNWRTRYCEIDIVAQKDNTIYFVEVKYRKSSNWGGGLEYITPTKQKQMGFAAELWVTSNQWMNDYHLAAIEVTGSDFKVTAFLTDL